jgi:hypothetical protein
MEQRGRNGWQTFDSPKGRNWLDLAPRRCHWLPPVAVWIAGKEGVDGSSPSEGFAKSAAYRLLPFAIWTKDRICNVHETSTEWSQRSTSTGSARFLTAFRLLVAASTERPRGGWGVVCGE